jgi:hypothetical protein
MSKSNILLENIDKDAHSILSSLKRESLYPIYHHRPTFPSLKSRTVKENGRQRERERNYNQHSSHIAKKNLKKNSPNNLRNQPTGEFPTEGTRPNEFPGKEIRQGCALPRAQKSTYDFKELPPGTPDITKLDPSTKPPRNEREARKSPFWPHFHAAMKVEASTLRGLGTGKVVRRSEAKKSGCRVLKGRWAYDWKKDKQGIMFAKARYTVMGCFQTPGVDYGETFAGVMNLKTFRTVLQLVNLSEDHCMEQWDVTAAFLYSKLDEKVYCDEPIGLEEGNPFLTCWLLYLSLYGLHQASRNWAIFLKGILVKAGMHPIPVDPLTFLCMESGAWLIICIHVDDLFPAFNKLGRALRDRVAKALTDAVKLKEMGEVDWALKCRIHRDKVKGVLKLSQENFTWEFLSRHGFLDVKGAETPTASGARLPAPEDVTDEEVAVWSAYPVREIIGGYLWLSTISRIDIVVAVLEAARVQHRPSKALWKWLVRIARYLRKYPHLGLVYLRPSNLSTCPLLEAWVDVSFAPQPDILKGKSVIGYIVKFIGATTTWVTMKSKRTLDSSSEAECNGVNELRKENVWQRDLQHYLGLFKVNEPTLTHEDNTATITLSGSATYHKRSKHFGVEWYATKEAIEEKELALQYIKTNDQTADALTKNLQGKAFIKHRGDTMGSLELQLYFGTMDVPESE